jgi:four helix bundle protein
MSEKPFDLCERTFEFSIRIVKLCQWLDQRPGTARVLSKQVLRSGTAIGANVEEGQGGQSRADFVSKYSIARKEARETRYWLLLLLKSGICREAQIAGLLSEVEELLRILTTIIKKTRAK